MTTLLRRMIPAVLCFALLAPAQQDPWQKSIDAGLRALSQGAFETAETNLQSALDQAQTLGPAQISQTQLYLGLLFHRQGQYERALGFYARAASLREKDSGADYATTLELEARALRNLDRNAEANDLELRALKIRRDALRAKLSAETPPAPPRRVSEDRTIAAPRVIERSQPEYSEEARLFRLNGTVELALEIWPDGRAHNIELRKGLGLGLDEKAIEALQQWRFRPAEKDGKPVIVSAVVTINFQLL